MAFATYRFGEFRLDPARHEPWRGDEELTLPLKVFDCIVHLVENRDRTIGRDELTEALWGDVHLTDSALGQVIRQARQALGDSGDDQHVIQTVRSFGPEPDRDELDRLMTTTGAHLVLAARAQVTGTRWEDLVRLSIGL